MTKNLFFLFCWLVVCLEKRRELCDCVRLLVLIIEKQKIRKKGMKLKFFLFFNNISRNIIFDFVLSSLLGCVMIEIKYSPFLLLSSFSF